MAISDDDSLLFADSGITSVERRRELHERCSADVRSIVQLRFSRMEQTHDRIRAKELAAHRRERTTS